MPSGTFRCHFRARPARAHLSAARTQRRGAALRGPLYSPPLGHAPSARKRPMGSRGGSVRRPMAEPRRGEHRERERPSEGGAIFSGGRGQRGVLPALRGSVPPRAPTGPLHCNPNAPSVPPICPHIPPNAPPMPPHVPQRSLRVCFTHPNAPHVPQRHCVPPTPPISPHTPHTAPWPPHIPPPPPTSSHAPQIPPLSPPYPHPPPPPSPHILHTLHSPPPPSLHPPIPPTPPKSPPILHSPPHSPPRPLPLVPIPVSMTTACIPLPAPLGEGGICADGHPRQPMGSRERWGGVDRVGGGGNRLC